jgi:hypothetical protein
MREGDDGNLPGFPRRSLMKHKAVNQEARLEQENALEASKSVNAILWRAGVLKNVS